MELSVFWFVVICVLFAGFFFLEGFDFGVGILLPFISKNDIERRTAINAIGPFWDGNEVWLLSAGGAIFAAFPLWYATMFSGFYLAFFIFLLALIIRGVAFEFRGKVDSPHWKKLWDMAIFIGSLLAAVLCPVAMANLIHGVPIALGEKSLVFTGGFFDLLSVFTLTAGIAACSVFIYHGSVFLALKTEGEVQTRAAAISFKLGLVACCLAVLLAVLAKVETDLFNSGLAVAAGAAAIILLGVSTVLSRSGRFGKSMIINCLAVICGTGTLFAGLFPRVMVSTLGSEFNLTIYNSSSSDYTLKIMSVVALTLVPVILAYQGWTYWVFRKRVSVKHLEY